MGSSTTKTQQHTDSTQTSGPSQDFIDRGNAVLDQATPLATNYVPFDGSRVADFNSLFGQAQGLVQNQASQPSSDLTAARSAVAGVQGAIDPTRTVQSYMNPYLAGVLQPTLDTLNQQGQIARNSIGAGAAAAGAFGDSSYGLATAQQLKDQSTNATNATNQVYSQGYQQAQSAKQADLQTLLSAGSQDQSIENADLTRSSTLSGLLDNYSNQQRAIDQAKLDSNYQAYQDQQTQPLARLSSLMQLIGAAPKQTTTTGTSDMQGSQTTPSTALSSLGGTVLSGLFSGGSGGFGASALGGLAALL